MCVWGGGRGHSSCAPTMAAERSKRSNAGARMEALIGEAIEKDEVRASTRAALPASAAILIRSHSNSSG